MCTEPRICGKIACDMLIRLSCGQQLARFGKKVCQEYGSYFGTIFTSIFIIVVFLHILQFLFHFICRIL